MNAATGDAVVTWSLPAGHELEAWEAREGSISRFDAKPPRRVFQPQIEDSTGELECICYAAQPDDRIVGFDFLVFTEGGVSTVRAPAPRKGNYLGFVRLEVPETTRDGEVGRCWARTDYGEYESEWVPGPKFTFRRNERFSGGWDCRALRD